MDNLNAIAVIIGITNGVRLFKEGTVTKNYWGFILFAIAMGCGILFGFTHMFGLTVESGIVVALASSGLYRVGEKVGGQ